MKLGVDLGGTKIEAVVIGRRGEVIWRRRVSTPKSNYEQTLATIATLVTAGKAATGMTQASAIGMGTPGAETRKGVMKNCNSTALNGKPLGADLSRMLQCPVHIANDANCFALAEMHIGQGCHAQGPGGSNALPESLFGVILGTGVGGGIVVEGKLLRGANAIAGEWGHNPIPHMGDNAISHNASGRECYCGRKNCVETFLSGPGLALSYQLRYGEMLTPKQIVSRMKENRQSGADPNKASIIWQEYMQQLAGALAQVVNILDPALIVLGGGLSSVSEIYEDIVPLMAPHVFTDIFATPVLPALAGDSAGVFGAAWLVE